MFITLAVVAVVGVALVVLKLASRLHKKLPPGPKGFPIVGNLFDLPPTGGRDWEHWATHKDQYGAITSLTVLGSTIIVLHDYASAFEILEKKCGHSAERPRLDFLMNMCNWGHNLALQQFDDLRHRTGRKQLHSYIGTPASMARFNDVQELQSHRFLLRVLRKPKTLGHEIRAEAGAIILDMAYGYTTATDGSDPLVDLMELALTQMGVASQPGAWPVDNIPWLKYLPNWLPGTSFKRIAAQFKAKADESAARPFRFVEAKRADGTAMRSFVSTLHEKAGGQLQGEDAHSAMWTAQSMYAGGADTTVSTLALFFMAMMLFPEIQSKAREEIDRVVGSDRLPSLDDREQLPYVGAIVKECLRWHPVTPTGVPHALTADYEYDGYTLPKGAMVIPSHWAMAHDPDVYANPSAFNPDRFMGEQPEMDPSQFIFGFGRRVCPGRLLARSSVFLTIARSLAVFRISKPVDANGNAIEPNMRFEAGLVSHPAPFDAMITARSDAHVALIEEVEKTHPERRSSAKELEAITTW
ncbi:putative cytochrome P450 [Septoria linicola]|nr:putative cytochrome P450 [Septoria linicola]